MLSRQGKAAAADMEGKQMSAKAILLPAGCLLLAGSLLISQQPAAGMLMYDGPGPFGKSRLTVCDVPSSSA